MPVKNSGKGNYVRIPKAAIEFRNQALEERKLAATNPKRMAKAWEAAVAASKIPATVIKKYEELVAAGDTTPATPKAPKAPKAAKSAVKMTPVKKKEAPVPKAKKAAPAPQEGTPVQTDESIQGVQFIVLADARIQLRHDLSGLINAYAVLVGAGASKEAADQIESMICKHLAVLDLEFDAVHQVEAGQEIEDPAVEPETPVSKADPEDQPDAPPPAPPAPPVVSQAPMMATPPPPPPPPPQMAPPVPPR